MPTVREALSIGRVIFLDIDGVLNRTRAATHIRLDDDLMPLLKAQKRQRMKAYERVRGIGGPW